jgi:hypothetical protein
VDFCERQPASAMSEILLMRFEYAGRTGFEQEE